MRWVSCPGRVGHLVRQSEYRVSIRSVRVIVARNGGSTYETYIASFFFGYYGMVVPRYPRRSPQGSATTHNTLTLVAKRSVSQNPQKGTRNHHRL